MMSKYKIDFKTTVPFGPRSENGYCEEGTHPCVDTGVDPDFTMIEILRFSYAYKFELKDIIPALAYHLEWRKTFVPRPKMQE